MSQHNKGPGWVSGLLLTGILILIASRFYFNFVFLPEYHGSLFEAASRLWDFSGWLAIVTSLTGIAFHLIAAACFLSAAATGIRPRNGFPK